MNIANPVGLGLDIVLIETIRYAMTKDTEAASGWLSSAEIEALGERATIPQVLAGRVAAKEAVAKALGCGFSGDVVWQDVEVIADSQGAPKVRLSGGAANAARIAEVREVLVSISHVELFAAATALTVR